MVQLPNHEQLTKDKSRPNAMNMTYGELAKQTLNQLTLRQIHKHFMDKFGDIHRIYVGRDFHEMHAHGRKLVTLMRHEYKC